MLLRKQNTVSSCPFFPYRLGHFKTEALQDITQFFAFIIKWESLICYIVTFAIQKCFSDEDRQCWVKPRPLSKIFVYKEIIVTLNKRNTILIPFFREKFHHSYCKSTLLHKLEILFVQYIPKIFMRSKQASTDVTEIFTYHHHLMCHCCLSQNPHSPE